MRKKEALWFYLLVFPWVFGFIVLTLGPMLYSFFLSLTNWDLFTSPKFLGWDNYINYSPKTRFLENCFQHFILRVYLRAVGHAFLPLYYLFSE
ncbi:hypothetical protein [Candidatus Villigracilis saccharophilus]|uniref:hypothetical protein n=1 Tax=Candidatus Villigracilis saccharophilus TaxID=3140684 RepID=UPI0031E7191B